MNDRSWGLSLRASLAVNLVLVLLSTLAFGGVTGTSRAASIPAALQAPVRDDADLCSVMPKGSEWSTSGVQGDPTRGCRAENNSPDGQVDSAEVDKSDSIDQNHSDVQAIHDSIASGGQAQTTAPYGDPGYSYEVAGDTAPNLVNRRVPIIYFARNCYYVNIQVALDSKNGDVPFPMGQARALAASLDAKLKSLPCAGSAAAPTATATEQTSPNLHISVHLLDLGGLQDGVLLYGDTATVTAKLTAVDLNTNQEPENAYPISVKLLFDGSLVNQGQTDGKGRISLTFTAPASTPDGRSSHTISIAADRAGAETQPDTRDLVVVRGLGKIVVALDGVSGVHQSGDIVTISGRVSKAADPGMSTSPVDATVTAYDDNGGGQDGATGPDGKFSIQLPIPALIRSLVGNKMVVSVLARPKEADKLAAGESSVAVLTSEKDSLVVTASTDKAAYDSEETITLSGMVTVNGKPVQASVDVTVDNVSLGPVQAGPDGQFESSFLLSDLSSPSKLLPPYSMHLATAAASSPGYTKSGQEAAYFRVNAQGDDCQAESMVVSNAEGFPSANMSTDQAQANLGLTGPASPLRVGSGVTQGMEVKTDGAGRVAFNLSLDSKTNIQAGVGLTNNSHLEVVQYCRDSTGRLHVVLRVDKTGQVLVQWPSGANADLKILTPGGGVSDVHTLYSVTVDEEGMTSLATLEGTARLTDSGGATIDVDAGNQVTVPAGQSISGIVPLAIAGQVDPELLAMLPSAGKPGSTSGSANAPSPPTTNPTSALLLPRYMPWLIVGVAVTLFLIVMLLFVLARSRSRKPVMALPPPMIMPSSMPVPAPSPFTSVEARYQSMREEMAAGRMSQQQCDAELATTTVRDAYGRAWMLDGNTGRWMLYDGTRWTYSNPYEPG